MILLRLGTKVLILCLGIAFALATTLTALGYSKARGGLREQAEGAMAADASGVADATDRWNEEKLRVLQALAVSPVLRRVLQAGQAAQPADLAAADAVLATVAAADPDVDSIGVLDLRGTFIRSSNPKDLGQNVAQRDYFQNALRGLDWTSGVAISTITDAPSIFHSVPVRSEQGQVIAVIRSRSSLRHTEGLVEAARGRVGAGAVGVLLDEQGLLIASSVSSEWRLKPVVQLSDEVVKTLLKEKRWGKKNEAPAPLGDKDLASAVGITQPTVFQWTSGTEFRHAVAVPLRRTRWVFVVALPVTTFERSAREFLSSGILSGAVGLVLASLLSLLFARRVVGPIRRLTEVSSRIVSEGDLTQHIVIGANDEVGQLAGSFSRMVDRLREALTTLRQSAGVLTSTADGLSASVAQQSEFVSRQAAALQETQVTAQEIKQTSLLAAEKAESVLQVANRADEVGRVGENAIERSIAGITGVRSEAEEIKSRIGELSDRTRQIGGITDTVKDLADQSNMLALNAAIEAVRSGEHGKGFAVVAREIRSLADQSIQATGRVREILQDISAAIEQAVAITAKGTERMEGGLVEARASGENLRALSQMMSESSAAVRQIAAAVGQQNAGIVQIFTAVTDQLRMMEETRARLEETGRSAQNLKALSRQVAELVGGYRL
jgi:methyl-accepting chemotaxis protein